MAINTGKVGHIFQNCVSKIADVQGVAMVTPDDWSLAVNHLLLKSSF